MKRKDYNISKLKKKNKRKIKFIDKEFQSKFILSYIEIITISVGLSLIITALYAYFTTSPSFNNFKVIYIKVVNGKQQIVSLFRIIFPIILISGLITSIIGVFTGLIYSHKIAGPIYRFKKNLKTLLENKNDKYINFQVRKNDEFKELSELLHNFYQKYEKLEEEIENLKKRDV